MDSISAAKPKSRLLISQLVLENFKSYGGKKVIGPFHKRFSSIVGPNGSGKSNVIDAMLFVFGKRAKKLRLKKVSELIHRSAKYPDLDFARVSVHFQDIVDTGDGDDDYTVVEGSEIVVSRTALRNNSSKYRVDGKEMKFKEVGALLRKRGIDLDHNRFLILQGEVEQISMMRPKAPASSREPAAGGGDGEDGKKAAKERGANSEDGLLEFLEDIIGSNQFVEPIEEAQMTLEEAQQARAATINRVKSAQNEAESLKDAKDEAEALLTKQKETLRAKAHMYQVMLAEQQVHSQALDERAVAFEQRAEEEADRMRKAEDQNKHLSIAEKETASDLKAVDARLASSRGKFGAFEKRDIQLREDLKAAKAAGKKTQAAIKKDTKKVEESQQRVKELEEGMLSLEESVAAAESDKAKAEAALEQLHEQLQGRTAGLREEMSAAEVTLAPLAGRKAEAAAALETARAELQVARQESERARDALRQLQSQAAQAEQASANATRGVEAARSTIVRCEGRLPGAIKELDELQTEESKAVSEVRVLRGRVEEGRHALAQGSQSSTMVQRLMQATKKGGELSGAGLHGRLGDLGDVPASVDVAVSTAAPALNYLVVDSTEGGQHCIEFLRKHNLGRARFVVLDRIRWAEKKMQERMDAPAGTERLFDLVRPSKAKFAPAFYFAMRDTLVAADMESAIKVAYEGGKPVWRVVTQQGQLIESTGAMSGGGKAVRKGAMRLRSAASGAARGTVSTEVADDAGSDVLSADDVARLGRELATMEARAGSCRHRISTLEAEIKGLETSLEQARFDLQKHESAASSLEAQLGDVRARLEVAEKAAQDEAEAASKGKGAEAIRALESTAESAERSLADASKSAAAAEHKVVSLREQVVSAGGAALKAAQAESKAAKQALGAAAKSLTKAKTDVKTQGKACAKARAAIAKAESEIVAQQNKQEALAKELRDMEEQAAEVMDAVASAEADRKMAVAAVEKCRAERESVEKELGSVKSVVVEVESGLKEIKQAQRAAKQKSERWEQLLGTSRAEYGDTMDTLMQFVGEEEDATEAPLTPQVASSGAGASESKSNEDDEDESRSSDASMSAGPSTASTEQAAADRELQPLSDDEMARMREEGRSSERLQLEVTALEEDMQRMKDGVNMKAIEEYYSKRRDYLAKVAEMDSASAVEAERRTAFESLRKERLDMFMDGFAKISLKLKEMYRMITLGGDAELELVDSLDPFNEGIVFSVRPPKKSWKQIANLSGGEKTLSSLALIFALHHYKPTPLYVMDEIDAALDFRNVSIVANYIKERTQDAQFIVISLRNNMFELADRLVGIYKTFDVTKSVTIAPRDFVQGSVKDVSGGSGSATSGAALKGGSASAAQGGGGQHALTDVSNETT